ncbi:MAG: hypothetical protein ACOZNI_26125 [Myxococcota bacterium]
MRSFVLAALFLSAPARAGDDDDDLFKDNTAKRPDEVDASSFSEDDDLGIPTFSATPKPDPEKDLSAYVDPRAATGSNTKMPLDVVGKAVLGDNWAPAVVIADKDAVVIEIPVLYARSRAEFDGVPYWLVAEAYADGKKVAESRMMVTRESIADKGPSVQFFRVFSPVPAASGVLEIKVGKAATGADKPSLLFTRSVSYKI